MPDVMLELELNSTESLVRAAEVTKRLVDSTKAMLDAYVDCVARQDKAGMDHLKRTFIRSCEQTNHPQVAYMIEATLVHAELTLEKIVAELESR